MDKMTGTRGVNNLCQDLFYTIYVSLPQPYFLIGWPILVSILSKSYHIFHSPGLEVRSAKLCQYLYFVVVVRPQERQRRSVQPWCEPARCMALPPRTWTPSRSAQQCCFVTSHSAPLARSPYKSSTWTKCSQALSSTSQRYAGS